MLFDSCRIVVACHNTLYPGAASGRFASLGVALFAPLEWPVLAGADVQAAT